MRLNGVLLWLLLAAAAGGCEFPAHSVVHKAAWDELRPLSANDVKVGGLRLNLANAEFSDLGDRVSVVVVVANGSQEVQQFDPSWVSLRGASGRSFLPSHLKPGSTSLPPGERYRLTYLFEPVPRRETSQMTLLVVETEIMKFGVGACSTSSQCNSPFICNNGHCVSP